ncbi:ATP synthase F1 subunit delta [Hufsiella ginkgonis]|uniref:ATP synthase subunit delta n=1 Tax=Hufsiella ginkgonis TaxID=2695274 RepID=A0A7K1Y2T1_9SPHI|nr:ATP synthase F1 subunit delta [Hufsiella ginkgonis]MXV17593.1 ATP synthase F1 subunit delta [Hufsiella ginkgonis]
MSEIQVASRYAKSLIDLAQEENALEAVRGDIELFLKVCRSNRELQAVLKNPIISPSKKIVILEELFGNTVHKVVLSFFRIVTSKMRSGILFATAKEFINEYNKRKGIVKASVISAVPLSEENKQQITDTIKAAMNGEVLLEAKVDPNLIGGFILKVGDRQFDASIASNLRKLKKEFAEG